MNDLLSTSYSPALYKLSIIETSKEEYKCCFEAKYKYRILKEYSRANWRDRFLQRNTQPNDLPSANNIRGGQQRSGDHSCGVMSVL
jgi:hypothetical protein